MTAGLDAGCVRLRLRVAGERVTEAAVSCERPDVTRVLRGRPADAAVAAVPLLFALCGKAQGRAARLALEAARGTDCAAHLDPAIRREALREHLWRWLLELPPLLGEPAMREAYVAAAGWVDSDRRADLAALLAGPAIAALQRRLAAAEQLAGSAPRLLPALDARGSLACWPRLDADFCRVPQWQGAAAETGALARRRGRTDVASPGLAARWLARLDELRDWAAGIEDVGAGGTASAAQVAAGRGRAAVETARGLLLHEIALDGERIDEYLIVAPTEWNFHPRGPLPAWLSGREAVDRPDLQAFAARAVAALDPCVRWELEWL